MYANSSGCRVCASRIGPTEDLRALKTPFEPDANIPCRLVEATLHLDGVKARLYRRRRQPVVLTDEEPPLWFLFAPYQSRRKLQRIGGAHSEPLELNGCQLADGFCRLDFAPRAEELPQAHSRC